MAVGLRWFLSVGLATSACVAAPIVVPPVSVPPPPPALVVDGTGAPVPRNAGLAGGGGYWEIGDLTDEEQLLLERINRTRAEPAAEAERLIGTDNYYSRIAYDQYLVDLGLFRTAMQQFPSLPPLAPHPQLLQSARGHSQWMLENAVQLHDQETEQGTVTLVDRIQAAGFTAYRAAGESIYSYGYDVEHIHAAFEVDWGLFDAMQEPIAPGMQDPPGHRLNNHNAAFREIGVSVLPGNNTVITPVSTNTVGPRVVTLNFGTRWPEDPMVTGVVYFDLDQDGEYDMGEGVGGVEVTVSGSGTRGRTSFSGGYAVPATTGTRQVTFSAGGQVLASRTVNLVADTNLKQDLAIPYVAPVLSGPLSPGVGRSNPYVPVPVPGVEAYSWEYLLSQPWAGSIGAEPSDPFPRIVSVPGYDVVQTQIRESGTAAFHLAHFIGEDGAIPGDQSLTPTNLLYGGTSPRLEFQSRLGIATEVQEALVELSLDLGISWQTVWSRAGAGTNSPGQQGFETVSVPLPAAAARGFTVRFRYALGTGLFYPQASGGIGWYIDGVRFIDTLEMRAATSGESPAGSPIQVVPPAPGTFALRARPRVGGRWFPFGPPLFGSAETVTLPTEVTVESFVVDSGMLVLVGATDGDAGGMLLERADTPLGPWAGLGSVQREDLGGGRVRFRFAPPAGATVYRLRLP